MQCDICNHPVNSRLPFYCILCARDALYQRRVQLAQTLLERQNLSTEVEEITTSTSNTTNAAITRASKSPKQQQQQQNPSWTIQHAGSEQALSEEKTESILPHSQSLREDIQKLKNNISERKARLHRRRQEFTSARQELLHRQASGVESVEKSIRRTELRWGLMHNKTAESRIILSREAAMLYGLQQKKRRKGGIGRDIYYVGGVPIFDLRDLNNASPTQVTTSTTNLAHLVHLISHYFSLRLPAEITLPHRDYPFPTVFSPNSSYTGYDVPFPGSTPSHSSSNSPSASRHVDHRPVPKPRPLHLQKKLSTIAKDDIIAYYAFVEGITFLAWDIAWLCKTQGLAVGDGSWEEICAMGKNLWQLLLTPTAPTSFEKEASSKITPQKREDHQPPKAGIQVLPSDHTKSAPPPGYFSHGTACGFLGAATGFEHMRSWRLQSPVKVIENVKNMLLAERTGAEWELLEENEWEVGENEPNSKEEPLPMNQVAIEETGVLVKPERYEDPVRKKSGDTGSDEKERGKNTSGWTKLKNRCSY
ncbi:hypothetical protein ACLMJK_006737 [Lecanora helva]